MSKTTTFARIQADCKIVKVSADGKETSFPAMPVRPMTESEIKEAAAADPDVVSADVMGGKVLGKPIPRAATRTMQGQMPGANKRGHVILDRAAIRASCLGNFTDRDTSAFAAKLQDLNRELR